MEEQQNQRNDPTTFSIMTCSLVTCGIATLRMLIFSITAFIIAAFNIDIKQTHTYIQHNDILHNDTQHCDTQNNAIQITIFCIIAMSTRTFAMMTVIISTLSILGLILTLRMIIPNIKCILGLESA